MRFFKRNMDRLVMKNIFNRFTDLTDIRVAYYDKQIEIINGCYVEKF